MKRVVDHCREKSAVMTDQQYRGARAAEVFLEPLGRLEVEVIRRLVEEQDVGRRHELPGESHPPAFASAQRIEAFRPRICRVETKPVQHRIDTGSDLVPTLALESLEVVRVSIEHRGRRRITEFSDASRLLAQRALEVEQMLERAGNRLPYRDRIAEVSVLLE